MADRPQKPSPPSSPLKTTYLALYNGISTVLWGTILGRVLLVAGIHGTRYVHPAVGEFAKWTQTIALLEVVHSLFGLVRAPIQTTAMQVASRLLLVWPIVHLFPLATSRSPFYSTMLLAWSITEVIRYSYFFLTLTFGSVPSFLLWLRYNTFFVLYPLGIVSECVLVWKASTGGAERYWGFREGLWVVLGVYVPGSYILFTHMMAQRRKIMRANRVKTN